MVNVIADISKPRTELFSLASSPAPGLYFSDPYIGVHFLLDGDLVLVRWFDRSEEHPPTDILLGKYRKEEDVAILIADFLDAECLETPLAVSFHHTPISSEEYALWSALPHVYWLRLKESSPSLVRGIDAILFANSERYRQLARLVSMNPEDPSHNEWRGDDIDFSEVYEQFSGMSNRGLE